MVRRLLVLALAACGGPRAPSRPPPPLPVDAAIDEPAPDAPLEESTDGNLPPDDEPDQLTCTDVVRDIADYPPALRDDAPERNWNLAIRGHVINEDCEHDWSIEVRQCVASQGAAACAAQLPNDLVDRLTKLGELGDKIRAAKTKPATIGCRQAVAGHYGPARWVGKLDGFTPKVRTQMIADSRNLMQKACTTEQWSDSTRACLSLGGGDLCFFHTTIHLMWGYPADGSVRSLGIRQCDDYDAAVAKLAACKGVEPSTRDALIRMSAALKANIAAAPPAERARRGQSCDAGIVQITDMAAVYGC